MTIVTDPDNLDRWQVLVDPVAKSISIRGLGTERVSPQVTGSGDGTTSFYDQTNDLFVTSGVAVDDILTIFSDPSNDGGIIGHYKVTGIVDLEEIQVDRVVPASTTNNLDYKINQQEAQGSLSPAVADGVTMQCIYSFLKEEWRTKSGPTNGEDLIKYTFPIVSITSEQFEIGGVSNSWWDFADDSGDGADADESPRNLIRTGGWASINEAGEIINNYPSIITLGSLDSDAQVYYQLTSATTNPTDFVLTGPVNQSIETLSITSGVQGEKIPVGQVIGSTLVFSTGVSLDSVQATSPAADFVASGYVVGDSVQIRTAEDGGNNGFFPITAISTTSTSNDTLEVAPNSFTANGADTAARLSPVVDNRDYLVLRVRKKAKSYSQSEIADIGVSEINTIVNRFPLAHVDDPAIVLDDGAINGDGTNTNFQVSASVETGTDGVISDPDATDGLFTFGSATATWNTGGAGSQLYAGDTLEITEAGNAMLGVYEVSSVTSDTGVVLIEEPGRGVTTGSALDYTARSRVLRAESSTGKTENGATDEGNFYDASATLNTLVAGDILRIKDGVHEGYYNVVSGIAGVASGVAVDTRGTNSANVDVPDDYIWTTTTSVTYDVLDDGMHLSYKSANSTQIPADVQNLVFNSGNSTIDVSGIDVTTSGYYIGGNVTVAGSTLGAANDGTYIVSGISDGGGTNSLMTVTDIDGSAAEFVDGTETTSATTLDGTYGYVRQLGTDHYSFNWKLEGNGGNLAECFQYLQKQLRQTYDIDEGTGVSRGDITDLLMTFASPNGTTLNLFIDNVDAAQKNNLTQQDQNDTDRNFPFLVALKIALNTNILNAAQNRIIVFFTDADGTPGNDDEFGTVGASIVQDSANQDMEATDYVTASGDSSPLTFEYDYTAGGGSDVPVTIVCISTDTGQYVQTTATLTRSNEVNASLVAGLERNYENP
jgi:hypothetical protein